MRYLEADSTRIRLENAGGCAKLKAVTEIIQSSAHDTFIAECLS